MKTANKKTRYLKKIIAGKMQPLVLLYSYYNLE